MIKYIFYLKSFDLFVVLINIFKRKLLNLFGLYKSSPFNIEQAKVVNRIYVLKQLSGKDKIIIPDKAYKLLYEERSKLVEKNPYKFGGGGDHALLYNVCRNNNINAILETGVANGWTTLSILLSIRKDNKKFLTSIDLPYPYLNSQKYIASAVPNYLKDRWQLLLGRDYKILSKLNNTYDLVHYDSDKSYYGKLRCFEKIWSLLKKHGIFISDDVSDNNAFIDFAISKNKTPTVYKYSNKYIGFLIK